MTGLLLLESFRVGGLVKNISKDIWEDASMRAFLLFCDLGADSSFGPFRFGTRLQATLRALHESQETLETLEVKHGLLCFRHPLHEGSFSVRAAAVGG